MRRHGIARAAGQFRCFVDVARFDRGENLLDPLRIAPEPTGPPPEATFDHDRQGDDRDDEDRPHDRAALLEVVDEEILALRCRLSRLRAFRRRSGRGGRGGAGSGGRGRRAAVPGAAGAVPGAAGEVIVSVVVAGAVAGISPRAEHLRCSGDRGRGGGIGRDRSGLVAGEAAGSWAKAASAKVSGAQTND